MNSVDSTVSSPSAPVARRDFLKLGVLGTVGWSLSGFSAAANGGVLPDEPLKIGHEPQFLFDMHIVDNHWPVRRNNAPVRLVFHRPQKHSANPLLRGAGRGGYLYAFREQGGPFRMYYQASDPDGTEAAGPKTGTAFAESDDGLRWNVPELGLYEWRGSRKNNIVWMGSRVRAAGTQILEIPERDRRGYRYVMLSRSGAGLELVGSQDGIHWDADNVQVIKPRMHSDTYNTVVYDEQRRKYVWFGRAKHAGGVYYRGGGDRDEWLTGGASRRVARMTSDKLWTEWEAEPQTVLIPDSRDAEAGFNYFYGMPVRYHAGIYWGFLWPFKRNTDVYTELVVSRDGIHWQRLPDRPRLLEFGDEGAWDSGMIFAGPSWVEVGDQWWIYYSGWDGPHGSSERTPGIGLATVRKEGFYSLRGPRSGGVVATRSIRWPGGPLLVNANAADGELKVRVTDAHRQEIKGFGYEECEAFRDDSVRHAIRWNGRSLDELAGQAIRIDFLLQDADLFTFVAGRE